MQYLRICESLSLAAVSDKLQSTAFLDTLQSRLPALTAHATPSDHSSLQADLKSHINTIRNHSKIVASKTDPRVLEKKGVNLWNLATRHSRTAPSDDSSTAPKARNVTLGLLKSLAFLLLACGSKPGRDTNKTRAWDDAVRLLRSANRAARTCLDTSQLDLCIAIFEKAADVEQWMDQNTNSLPTAPVVHGVNESNENDRIYQRLKHEYLGLRILLVDYAHVQMRCAWQLKLMLHRPGNKTSWH